MEDYYDKAYEDAMEYFDTEEPTCQQVEDMVIWNIEKITDEAMNYHDQDGREREL